MANTINVPRSHLIMGLCLPMAVLLGYFLAQPVESGSFAVVVLVVSVLCFPLLMKWHHPLLVVSWNAAVYFMFLPGRPSLAMVMAVVSLFFAVLGRSVNPDRRFIQVPSFTRPLIVLFGIVFLTAMVTGGIGLRSMGSDRYGGKNYLNLLTAAMGYFAFTSLRIPPHKAGLYVALFFLSGLTALIGDLAYAVGPRSFLLYVFVPDTAIEQLGAGVNATPGMARFGALPLVGAAIYCWLLARHGVRGVLDMRRPWRLFMILLAAMGCLISGYRSSILLFGFTFAFVFWFEGLHRTRVLAIFVGATLIASAIILPQAAKLPLMAQRALSFLPIPMDPVAKESAKSSTEWRVEMWKQVLPQVPKYLITGKGYALDPNDLVMAQLSAMHGFGISASGSMAAGDYHNGPLSVLIPFGIFGTTAFIWLIAAGMRLLYYYHRYGDPALQRINTFLLGSFVAKTALFVFVFGSLSTELFVFTGLVGFSVSLNGPPQPAVEPEISPEPLTVFSERAY